MSPEMQAEEDSKRRFEEETADVKEFRKQADALMNRAKELEGKYGRSRAYSLMFTHAELTKMYGGKRLEEMGTPFPPELADKAENAQ